MLHPYSFTLKSDAMEGQAQVEQLYSRCGGDNISPQLSWVNPPEGTHSFAITMYDPDAPSGSGWWHWVLFDIPAAVRSLPENAGNVSLGLAPEGSVQVRNDFGEYGYCGPCPPVGDGIHTYIITVHALKIPSLGLDENVHPAMAGFVINANVLQKASLVLYYQRK
ncbi:MAG: YbhB/YbcL family Raf kinase inhibitor-like protein [Bacteroidales bacterium]|nr:YbhB/YbcL family Raf kinase inhibitor-like protein [Bacteroidales bacterium]